jgi:pimeloyl-ACP methyl ester carboxylesterase
MAKPTPRKRILRMLWICLGLYLAAGLLVTLLQRRMLYHPNLVDERVLLTIARNDGFEPWLNSGGQRIGWRRPGSAKPAPGRFLVVHGNAGHALDRSDYAKDLQVASGFDAFLLEYPGYGSRPGKPSQTSLIAAAEEAFALLHTNGPVHLLGESLGCGVAAHLAGAHPAEVAGVLLFTPYHNLTSVAQTHMPVFPVRFMLLDRFPAETWLKNYRGPVAILLAGNDEVVPDKFGRRLYDGYQGPKKLFAVPNAGHNDVHSQPPEWWKELLVFWQSSAPGK